ncbi:MAG: type II toxin-antitoxin system RelE/ParE family toxin [Deltaproteobacteria bacterium]|nr:type II toxin-antitoxin system RelE/ParE family toxin [Deltaproteobacteria bacterium]
MPYEIVYVREALADLKRLPKGDRLAVLAQIEVFLTHEPAKESRSRIRRLRRGVFPPYRLRIDPYRVLYDQDAQTLQVVVHGVGRKPEIYERLRRQEEQIQ